MRGWVSDVANYSQPIALGSVMRAFTAGEVVESRHPDYAPGQQDARCGRAQTPRCPTDRLRSALRACRSGPSA